MQARSGRVGWAKQQGKGVNKMTQDKFSTMVKDGKDLAQIIQSAPEDKQVLVSAVAEAFLNGLTAGEKLAAAERDSA